MEQLFDFSFFWNLFPIMFRYIDVTLGAFLWHRWCWRC